MSADIEPAAMPAAEARERVDRVKSAITQAREDLVSLWRERAWLALGYASWDELCDTEFGVRMALPRDERREVVAGLRREGMSTRAIGSALGVHHSTVADDAASVGNPTVDVPDRVTSLDGRQRPASLAPRIPPAPAPPTPAPAAPTVDAYLADQPSVQDASYAAAFVKALGRADDVLRFDAGRLADLLEDDETRLLDRYARSFTDFITVINRRRHGLRVVKGAAQ